MKKYVEKTPDKDPSSAKASLETKHIDNRPEAIAQRKLQEMANNSPQVLQLRKYQEMADKSNRVKQATQLQSKLQQPSSPEILQKQANNTGLPDQLKTGVENLSGMVMDDVKVHYNSSQPAKVQAHAYAQGTDIHLASGQEKHLPHEAWHVVQQKQGRVKPTVQMKKGVLINDDEQLEKEADSMGNKAASNSGDMQLKMKEPNAKGEVKATASSLPIQRRGGVNFLDRKEYDPAVILRWLGREGFDPRLDFLSHFLANSNTRYGFLQQKAMMADFNAFYGLNLHPGLRVLLTNPHSSLALWQACIHTFGMATTTIVLTRVSFIDLLLFHGIRDGLTLLNVLIQKVGIADSKIGEVASDLAVLGCYSLRAAARDALADLLVHHSVADVVSLINSMTMVTHIQRPEEALLLLPHAESIAVLTAGLGIASHHGLSAAIVNNLITRLPHNSRIDAIRNVLDLGNEAATRAQANAQQANADRLADLDQRAAHDKDRVLRDAETLGRKNLSRTNTKYLEQPKNSPKYAKGKSALDKEIAAASAQGVADIDQQLAADKHQSTHVRMPQEARAGEQRYHAFLVRTHYDPRSFTALDFARQNIDTAVDIITAITTHPILSTLFLNPHATLAKWQSCIGHFGCPTTTAILGRISVAMLLEFNKEHCLDLLSALHAQAGIANLKIIAIGNDLAFFGKYSANAGARTGLATLLVANTVANLKNMLTAMTMFTTDQQPPDLILLLPHAHNPAALIAGLNLAHAVRWTRAQVNAGFTALPAGSNANAIKNTINTTILGNINKMNHFTQWVHALNALIVHSNYSVHAGNSFPLGGGTTYERVCQVRNGAGHNIGQTFVVHYHPGAAQATVGSVYASPRHIKPVRGNAQTLRLYWDQIPAQVEHFLPYNR